MKIYKTQAEVKKDIKNGVLIIEGDVEFRCSISIDASIQVNAGNITAFDLTARDITAFDLNVGNITALDITAHNIFALDITAWSITADDISYHAFCNVYDGITCSSITARRRNCSKPVCLDGKLTIKAKQ